MQGEKISAAEIIRLYDEDMSIEEIAEKLNTNKKTLILILTMDGSSKSIKIIYEYKKNRNRKRLPMEEAVNEYAEGISRGESHDNILKKLSERYNISIGLMGERIREYERYSNRKIINSGDAYNRRKDLDLVKEEIIQKYKNGTSISRLVEEYECSYVAIRKRIDDHIFETGENVDKMYAINSFLEKNKEEEQIEQQERRESSSFKLASLQSIINIIEKYEYSFEELTRVAEMKGYIVLEETYKEALKRINEKIKPEEIGGRRRSRK